VGISLLTTYLKQTLITVRPTYQHLVNAMVLDEDKPHFSEGLVELLHLRAGGEILTGEHLFEIHHWYSVSRSHNEHRLICSS
jgi:hypothetical protein